MPETTDARAWCEGFFRRRRPGAGAGEPTPTEALALRAGGMGVWGLDLVTRELSVTERTLDLLGVDVEERSGFAWPDLVERLHADDRERVLAALETHLDGMWPFDVECRMRVRRDEFRWLRFTGGADWNTSGEAARIAGTLEDVTARRDAEEAVRRSEAELREAAAALRESEERFRELAENMEDLFWLEDLRSGAVVYVNPATEMIGATSPDEFRRDPADVWERQILDEDRALAGPLIGPASEAPSAEATFRARNRAGQVRWIYARTFPIRDGSGVPCRRGGIAQDVTEFRETQDQLREAQKLESIGQLAAGVAHEINTPIQYISDNLQFLESTTGALFELVEEAVRAARSADEEERGEALARVLARAEEEDLEFLREELPSAIGQTIDGAKQVAGIVAAMKDLSHPGCERELSLLDVNRAVEAAATVSRSEYKFVADLRLELAADLPAVPALAGPLGQVLVNLIVNAAHAIEERYGDSGARGTITIRTRDAGDEVEIQVADDGCGIPHSVRARVFDPFFTTKDVGRGTGQGLALAWSTVVDGHGGSLLLETALDEGTTFFVRLPRTAEAAEPAA